MEIDVLRLVKEYQSYIEIGVFLVAFAESLILVSLFVPATLILVAVGALEGSADGPLLRLIAFAAAGSFLGDLISFALGRRYGGHALAAWPFYKMAPTFAKAETFIARWGAMAIVLSKLAGPLRPVVPMVIGATSAPIHTFALYSFVSSIAWACLFLVPAYFGLNYRS
jgi:membrane protein DedA with SNARE-associated domain